MTWNYPTLVALIIAGWYPMRRATHSGCDKNEFTMDSTRRIVEEFGGLMIPSRHGRTVISPATLSATHHSRDELADAKSVLIAFKGSIGASLELFGFVDSADCDFLAVDTRGSIFTLTAFEDEFELRSVATDIYMALRLLVSGYSRDTHEKQISQMNLGGHVWTQLNARP